MSGRVRQGRQARREIKETLGRRATQARKGQQAHPERRAIQGQRVQLGRQARQEAWFAQPDSRLETS